MNKEKFLLYFKKNEKIVDQENDNEVKITNVIKLATSDITNAELTLVAKEIQKSCNQKVKYQNRGGSRLHPLMQMLQSHLQW